jgi:hypothetical protein
MRSISSSKTSGGEISLLHMWVQNNYSPASDSTYSCCNGCGKETPPTGHRRLSTLDQLADIPEEEIWLQKQKSARIRRVYQLDVQHFVLRCPSPRRPSSTHPVSRNKIRNFK